MNPIFYTDKDIAALLNMSLSWVRGQRHKRKQGLPHELAVDPRYIGRCPRYPVAEIDELVARFAA